MSIPTYGAPALLDGTTQAHRLAEVLELGRGQLCDFEALGGKLIELPASDWRAVVTAVAGDNYRERSRRIVDAGHGGVILLAPRRGVKG